MKPRIFLLILALSAPFLVSAEIVLKTPSADETITTMSPKLRAFLELSHDERRSYFSDWEGKLKPIYNVRIAQPYTFTWDCTEGETGVFTVDISEKEDFSESSPALILPPEEEDNNLQQAHIVNFEIGKTYYWRVSCRQADGKVISSKTGRFLTDPYPPRLLNIPEIGNIRDLGGHKGLDGRLIRQGLIYRSAGLNRNSKKEKSTGEYQAQATNLTPESIRYVNEVLGWKTDLDLRGPTEVAGMTGSPAGPEVKWVVHPSKAFASLFGKDNSCVGEGPEMTAKNFRLFTDRENYPIIFHCIAGSSRTGSLAYLLLGVLGVDMAEATKDWEITATMSLNYEERIGRLNEHLDTFGEPGDPFHKKVEAYLYKIGITPQEIADFRAIMLEESP